MEATRQRTAHFFCAKAEVRQLGSRVGNGQRGFTLVELIMTMVIIGILSAVAIPRFFDTNVFQSRGFADQVQASLRYAQKIAIAQHGYACATITANKITLTTSTTSGCGATLLDFLSGGTKACDGTQGAVNVLNAPCNVSISTSPALASFYFDPLGKPVGFGAQQKITVSGDVARDILIEAETGYVHQ